MLLFWGHKNKDGYLSNWYPITFKDDDGGGIQYKSTEHYMMYKKAILMGDDKIAPIILECSTPKAAKQLGRKVKYWDEQKWIENRERIMYEGCLAKFKSNEELKVKLIATHPKILVEASPYDKIWGIGMTATHKHAKDPSKWNGLNLLGKALTKVRETLHFR